MKVFHFVGIQKKHFKNKNNLVSEINIVFSPVIASSFRVYLS